LFRSGYNEIKKRNQRKTGRFVKMETKLKKGSTFSFSLSGFQALADLGRSHASTGFRADCCCCCC
jgi:hypothetical protein